MDVKLAFFLTSLKLYSPPLLANFSHTIRVESLKHPWVLLYISKFYF